MRLTKMLGLAMIAAIVAMAFVGAGSASAVLCKTNETSCNPVNQYPVPTDFTVSSGAVKITANFTALFKSQATLRHEGLSGSKLTGKFISLSWSNCTGCTEVTTTSLGTFTDEAVGAGNGKLFPEGVVILLKGCPFGVECTVRPIPNVTFMSLTGGTINKSANIAAKTTVKVENGGLCSSTGTGTLETEAGNPYLVLTVNGSASGSIFVE